MSPSAPPPFDLSGHVALVTGANHGIGAATGRPELYRENRASDAEDVLADIRAANGQATALEVDLTDPETPGRLLDAAEAEFGPVDIHPPPLGLRPSLRAPRSGACRLLPRSAGKMRA